MFFDSYTIVMTGIGGQGLITLLEILGRALVNEGYKVATSETHGLSQRGGKVVCFLRFGTKMSAPIPIVGSADIIIAFEKNCIADVLKFTKPDKSTILVISTYEEGLSDRTLFNSIKDFSSRIYFIPINSISNKLNFDLKKTNMLLLGYILRFLPLSEKSIEQTLIQRFSGDKLAINVEILKEGIKLE
ncbi:MAG: 2-oxoacid:acceptor oxidoreductase family protein [Promethearchaeota archaeon]